MEQNKLEQEIKQALENRTIQPSEMAWNKLDAMLAIAEGQKPKRNLGWLYTAAAILGFILIGSVFFSQTEEVIDKGRTDVVLDNQKPQSLEPQIKNDGAMPQVQSTPQVAASENVPVKTDDRPSVKNARTNPEPKAAANLKTAFNQNLINQNPIAQSSSIMNQKTEQQPAVVVPQTPADELVAATENQKSVPTPLKTQVKVDAGSLLSQVDGELELSFREKAIKSINKRFRTVKGALATRNSQ